MSVVTTVGRRIVSDYFLAPRIVEYRHILEKILEAGYTITSIDQIARAKLASLPLPPRLAVIRHDIDTDPAFAQEFAQVDASLGIHTSYYFRLSTFKRDVIGKVASLGHEVSYHYEEVATFAKEMRLSSVDALRKCFPEIREQFALNLRNFRTLTGLPCQTVAGHGDFANRKLGVYNPEILNDAELREKCGILCETYDSWYLGNFDVCICDSPFPFFWKQDVTPFQPISEGKSMQLLVHPRHWHCNRWTNTHENFKRLVEGVLLR